MKTCAFLIICLLSIVPLAADIDTATALKSQPDLVIQPDAQVKIPLSVAQTQKWQLAHMQVLKDGQAVFEWVHPGDSIDNWSELVQIQMIPFDSKETKKQSATEFAAVFMDILKKQFPTCQPSIISQTDKDVLLEFSLPDVQKDVLLEFSLPDAKNNEKPQAEIARIISTDKGIIRIAFTAKGADMPDYLRKEWIQVLAEAKIIPHTK